MFFSSEWSVGWAWEISQNEKASEKKYFTWVKNINLSWLFHLRTLVLSIVMSWLIAKVSEGQFVIKTYWILTSEFPLVLVEKYWSTPPIKNSRSNVIGKEFFSQYFLSSSFSNFYKHAYTNTPLKRIARFFFSHSFNAIFNENRFSTIHFTWVFLFSAFNFFLRWKLNASISNVHL